MANGTKAKTSVAFQELGHVLGAKPPKALGNLPAADLKDLTERIEAALVEHQATMAQAEESIISSTPRALRGTIRKVLG